MTFKDILRFIILSGLFAIPFICLYVADSMFFPFITGKNFTFRVLVEIIFAAWGILMVVDKSFRPRFSYALAFAGGFLAIIAIADFFGANPYRSFWSNYERMEGLVTHIHLFLYFLVAATVLQEERMWKWLIRTSIVASMFVAIIAFRQLFGFTETHQSATRLDATLGNSTYLAVYALFHAFLAGFLYLRDGAKNAYRWIYLVTVIINIAVLYYTQTRGSALGLIGGSFLTFLLIALFDTHHPKLKKVAISGLVGVVLLVIGFIAVKDSAYVQDHPVLHRFAEISFSQQTVKSRFMIWNMSWEGFKERPLLGWGQDNFIYVFSKHYDPKMFTQEPWFDRSHNVFFDWLIAGGILGLLAYLSMFAVIIYYLWFTKKGDFSIPEKAVLTGLLAGYFIHNVFVFDNLVSYILFFTVLAYIHHHYAEEAVPEPVTKKKHNDTEHQQDVLIAASVIIVMLAVVMYLVNIRNINANLSLIDSLRQPLSRDATGQAKIAIEDVLKQKLFGNSEAREQLGQLAFQAADPRLEPAVREKIFNLTRSEFEDEIKNDPENLRYQSFLAMLYARYGLNQEAEQLFRRAVELSPTRQSSLNDLGSILISMRRYEEAVDVFKRSFELEETNDESRLLYAVGLIYNNKNAEAENLLQFLRDNDRAIQFDNRLINAYGNTRQFDMVVKVVNEKIAQGKANARDYLGLGGALVELGQKGKAIEAFEQAKQIDPASAAEADQFIQQLQGKK